MAARRRRGTGSGVDVKEAVAVAKKYLAELYSAEEIADVGLEEVEYDQLAGQWSVTLGFARPWERNALRSLARNPNGGRSYKVLRVNDASGRVDSLKDRLMARAQ